MPGEVGRASGDGALAAGDEGALGLHLLQGARVLSRRPLPGLEDDVLGARVEGRRETTTRWPITSSAHSRRPPPLARPTTSPPARRWPGDRERPERGTLPQGRRPRAARPGGWWWGRRTAGGGRAAGDGEPPDGAGSDRGGATRDDRAPAHGPSALLDEGGGVGWVALAGEQVLDDGVEVDVERPVRGDETVRDPGRVVGGREPTPQDGGAVADLGHGIPSRSATSSGPAAQTDPAPTRARSRGVASRTTASSAVSAGSSSSGCVQGFGGAVASGPGVA